METINVIQWKHPRFDNILLKLDVTDSRHEHYKWLLPAYKLSSERDDTLQSDHAPQHNERES